MCEFCKNQCSEECLVCSPENDLFECDDSFDDYFDNYLEDNNNQEYFDFLDYNDFTVD